MERKCKNCKWGNCMFFKESDYFCGKYQMKPREVYFNGEECEKYEPTVELAKKEGELEWMKKF